MEPGGFRMPIRSSSPSQQPDALLMKRDGLIQDLEKLFNEILDNKVVNYGDRSHGAQGTDWTIFPTNGNGTPRISSWAVSWGRDQTGERRNKSPVFKFSDRTNNRQDNWTYTIKTEGRNMSQSKVRRLCGDGRPLYLCDRFKKLTAAKGRNYLSCLNVGHFDRNWTSPRGSGQKTSWIDLP